MSRTNLRQQIEQYLDRVDEPFLQVIHAMLDTYIQQQEANPLLSYDIDGTPRSQADLEKILSERLEAVRQGKYVTLDELRKNSEAWLRPTK